jgi:5-methylcytosine-specific restriction endonuclease McrA
MKPTPLQPRLPTARFVTAPAVLNASTVNPRLRGSRWTALRKVVEVEQKSRCVDCGRLWFTWRDHVDHDVELADGGTNDKSNLRLRCVECHALKSANSIAKRGV